MAIDTTVQGNGDTGITSYLFLGGAPIPFSQIFTGTPQYYPGSTLTVQEILTIRLSIDNPEWIDVDMNWYEQHKYLGTYQTLIFDDELGVTPISEGYLNRQDTLIKEYSQYTITANPSTLVAKHEQFTADNCNFYLQPEVYLFPGENTPVPGFRLNDRNPVLIGATTLSRAPLADTEYFRKIGGVGLFLTKGVSLISLRYRCAVINDIYTDYTPATAPQCVFIEPDCGQRFAAFLLEVGGRYETLTDCIAVGASGCTANTWVCPTNPTQTFTYYTGSPVG